MPLKQDRTSYNVSNNLKTALIGAGYDTTLKEGNTYYDGSGAEIHLVILALPGGTFRTVSNLLTTFSDIVAADEAAFVRMWVESELAVQIALVPGVEASDSVFGGVTWVHTITFNGTAQTGTDTKKVDAMAKALIKVLDLL